MIAYLGFLLLNDPVVGRYHYWSEPLEHFWERFRAMQRCDVHASGPVDGGPPCGSSLRGLGQRAEVQWSSRSLSLRRRRSGRQAGSFSEPVLVIDRRFSRLSEPERAAVVALRECRAPGGTGESGRVLAFPRRVDPKSRRREDVLVVNRARLVRDAYFTQALSAMKHPSYPCPGAKR